MIASETSEPVAIRITLKSGEVSSKTYAPLATPSADAYFVRSSTGKFCLDKASPVGAALVIISRQETDTSLASAGRIIAKFGIARSAAKCSTG